MVYIVEFLVIRFSEIQHRVGSCASYGSHCWEITPWPRRILKRTTFNWSWLYRFRDSVHYHRGRIMASRKAWHCRSQTFYILIWLQPGENWPFLTGQSFKFHPNRDMLPLTRPHFLKVPLSMYPEYSNIIFYSLAPIRSSKHMSLQGPYLGITHCRIYLIKRQKSQSL